ncbi:MAG: (2Fe-2S) ferredoxin domain-containing protein [Candidatus Aminicenantes bacterium]|nr:(2Fe-2S) ferredoxin domain-containing protein [Candidatus Aminicenantes bacterium]
MPKLTLKDLQKKREEVKKSVILREGGDYKAKVTVHMGTCGIAAGARKIMDSLLAEVEKFDARDVLVTTSGCAGLCSREPMATVELVGKAPVKYVDLDAEKMKKIFEEHVQGGNIVTEYALAYGSEKTSY